MYEDEAMNDIIADPSKGLAATVARVPELASDQATQLAILNATIVQWQSDYTKTNGLGAIDPSLWQHAIDFMGGLPDKLLAKSVAVTDCIDASFLPKP